MTSDEPTRTGAVSNASDETLSLIYDEVKGLLPLMSGWSDAIEAKVVAVFTVGSLLIGAIPALGGVEYDHWKWIPLAAAAALWLLAGYFAGQALWTQGFQISPDPQTVSKSDWTDLSADDYRAFRIGDMAVDFVRNQAIINTKADAVTRLMLCVAVESGFLVSALFIQAA